jgi:cytochrome oxidase Cu insertion factor (SCO1/SenC/PrrC family)
MTPLLLIALVSLARSAPEGGPFDPGPAVGHRLPPFEAVDQDGRQRTFESLRGPKGLVLVFFRSADW